MRKISRRHFIPLMGTALLGVSCLSANNNRTSDKIDRNSNYFTPPALKRGDTIGICAPAGAIKDPSEIDEFTSIINNLGYKVKVGKNVKLRYGYFSANDQERAEEFMAFIHDSSVQGIFFIRGGWGCARLLPFIDFNAIQMNPKVIMGFSDLTTLINAITTKTGLITFHGPGGNSSWNPYSVDYIQRLLSKKEAVNYKNKPDDAPIITYASGQATGELFGGNLTVLTSMIGSDYLPDWENKILFLEDVKEEPYSIDRMLTQLKLNGVFDKVNAIILGTLRECLAEEPEYSFTLEEVFEQHFSGSTFPVFYGAQFGHVKNKFTIPVGVKATVDADQGTIQLLYRAVH
ncbi:MAG: LD-carboxypeptidase [Crocinitomicaceae bacterium]|nr:LD-carboxypeptidase [Crocinitomicaceae bacterium]